MTINSNILASEIKYQEPATNKNPLIINKTWKKVLTYTEERNANLKKQKYSLVCCKDGKLSDKVILKAYMNHLDFSGALLCIGTGNNLNRDSIGRYVEN